MLVFNMVLKPYQPVSLQFYSPPKTAILNVQNDTRVHIKCLFGSRLICPIILEFISVSFRSFLMILSPDIMDNKEIGARFIRIAFDLPQLFETEKENF
jgi:hypothetical protein